MKRRLFLAYCLLCTLVLTAGNVTPEQAAKTALQFLNQRNPAMKSARMKMALRQPMKLTQATEAAAYYVFNVGEDNGYVMVSGSDLAPQVLAYATSGSFDQEQMPDNMRTWLQGYADQIAYLERTQGKYEAPRVPSAYAAIAPLITSTWDQGDPYNKMCPLNANEQRTVTGCVATALAQIINYYHYPEQTSQEIPAYTTETLQLELPSIPVTTIDWDNMLDSYDDQATEAQEDAVAMLMKLCGQALEMDYDIGANGGSCAYTDDDAKVLQNYFGYDKTVRNMKRSAFNADNWDKIIYNELANNRPVIYGGSSTTGGHSFIVDGYNGEGMFHINWGWGGRSDEYFLLSVLNPYNNESLGSNKSDDGFSYEQLAVIGIQHGTGEKANLTMTIDALSLPEGNTYQRTSIDSNFPTIQVRMNVWNKTGNDGEFYIGFCVLDTDGQWVVPDVLDRYQSKNLPNGYGYRDYQGLLTFGAGLPDGIYYIVPVAGTAEWEFCKGAESYHIKAIISGNTITLTAPTVDLECGPVHIAGRSDIGNPVTVEVDVHNNGTTFNKDVFLFINDKLTAGRIMEVAEGSDITFNIDYVPSVIGDAKVDLAYKDVDGNYQKICTGNITITANSISVAEALAHINGMDDGEKTTLNFIVKGLVSGKPEYNSANKEISFYLVDEAGSSDKFYIYKSNKFNDADITSKNTVKEGDEVVVMGYMQKYVSGNKIIPEMMSGSVILFINGETEYKGTDPETTEITVAKALEIINGLSNKEITEETYHVKGYVVGTPDIQKKSDGSFYGNANFYIADVPDGTTKLYGYRVRGLNNESINRADYLKDGDIVVVEGQLQKYNSTPEIVNGYIYSLVEEPTGLTSVTGNKPQETVRYNLAGQRVTNNYKGVVITGGRKIISR